MKRTHFKFPLRLMSILQSAGVCLVMSFLLTVMGCSQAAGGPGLRSGFASGTKKVFAFVSYKPQDPEWRKALGKQSVQKVAAAFSALTDDPYEVEVLVDPEQLCISGLKEKLTQYAQSLSSEDTFIMYSHTHGLHPGLLLEFGEKPATLSWNDLADAILALPARNVIIFTMSCHSGHLADVIKSKSASWEGRSRAGRNLVILTAASADQMPGPSPEPGVGNPFTYAVETAVRGLADGFLRAGKDGRVDLEELVKYVTATTREKSVGKALSPQFAGEYAPDATFVFTEK